MKSLLITLGHNSSAIFVDENNVVGYEQERLSGIKGDSQFPIDAINEIIFNVGDQIKNCNVYISHWFDVHSKREDFIPTKYMTQQNYDYIVNNISRNITYVNNNFTHHDAHAYSALSFYRYNLDTSVHKARKKQLYTIVADGFGTNQEVLSIYVTTKDGKSPLELIHRTYGYEASLGLMYQYATSFCGMKENQDEYKFLGYEAYIDEYLPADKTEEFYKYVVGTTDELLYLKDNLQSIPEINESHHWAIDTEKLQCAKARWYNTFEHLLDVIHENKETISEFGLRVIIGHFVQCVIERYFQSIVDEYNMDNILLVGGCFYNVKLNNSILSRIRGLLSIMPLAGDQGAAIGMYEAFEKKQFPFDTLAIGKRRMYDAEKLVNSCKVGNAKYIKIENGIHMAACAKEIAEHLANGKIVDLIYGNMEFGPRALCNTSTLMLPTTNNVAKNNSMNRRNEVMPCAPVCTQENADILFDAEELTQVVGSDRFMICTHDYVKKYSEQYGGVMHVYPSHLDIHSGRPQIVRKDTFMHEVLKRVQRICDVKCLVNTSFNVHGRPIVFSLRDIMHNYEFQCTYSQVGEEPLLYVIEIA